MKTLRILAALTLALAALAQTACNTMAGAGQDVNALGRGVTNTANAAR